MRFDAPTELWDENPPVLHFEQAACTVKWCPFRGVAWRTLPAEKLLTPAPRASAWADRGVAWRNGADEGPGVQVVGWDNLIADG